ncbi:hypothetical protein [Streptomyces smaragdinus]|uniref:hypothetical protein n=1 Tax=Streptomyces smaragdinus TaxID=2585196 RepID=UPI001296DCFE|nr:hypothetical protein [Streptomyces smaragdinus]
MESDCDGGELPDCLIDSSLDYYDEPLSHRELSAAELNAATVSSGTTRAALPGDGAASDDERPADEAA